MSDADQFLDALPHRPPFRFLTHVDELHPGQFGLAVWRVFGDEAFFAGHFPTQPIVPGVLIVEALAQLSGLVGYYRGPIEPGAAVATSPAPLQGKLAHVDVRFDDSVIPPAEIVLSSRQARVLGALRQFDVEARWQATFAARGRLTLAIMADAKEGGS